jgi:hypothetical protein
MVDPKMETLRSWRGLALALVCATPLFFSLPTLSDPLGQTEEMSNISTWAVGGRNLIRKGFWGAHMGADVSPWGRTSANPGIYAHHPPLPVWLSAVLQRISRGDALPRTVALGLFGAALYFLFQTLVLFVSGGPALVAVAAVATTSYALVYARMLTTVTICTPLVCAMLWAVSRRAVQGHRWGAWLYGAVVLGIFSGWDGFAGTLAVLAAAVVVELRRSEKCGAARALAVVAVGALSGTLLLAYFTHVPGGIQEVLRQGGVRSSLTWHLFWVAQRVHLPDGLGYVPLAALLLSPLLTRAATGGWGMTWALFLSSAPGLAMTLGMREGTLNHSFWSYNLMLPAAFGLAGAAEWLRRGPVLWQRLGALALGLQMAFSAGWSGIWLGREHELNSVGGLVRDYLGPRSPKKVNVLAAYDYFPFIEWYLDVPTYVAFSREQLARFISEGTWGPSEIVLADGEMLQRLHCDGLHVLATSESHRWVVTPVAGLLDSCSLSK